MLGFEAISEAALGTLPSRVVVPFYRPFSTETADVLSVSTETLDVLPFSNETADTLTFSTETADVLFVWTETPDVLPSSVDDQVQ